MVPRRKLLYDSMVMMSKQHISYQHVGAMDCFHRQIRLRRSKVKAMKYHISFI